MTEKTLADYCAADPDFAELVTAAEQAAAADPVRALSLTAALEAAHKVLTEVQEAFKAVGDDDQEARGLLLRVIQQASEDIAEGEPAVESIAGIPTLVAHVRLKVGQDYLPRKGEIA